MDNKVEHDRDNGVELTPKDEVFLCYWIRMCVIIAVVSIITSMICFCTYKGILKDVTKQTLVPYMDRLLEYELARTRSIDI